MPSQLRKKEQNVNYKAALRFLHKDFETNADRHLNLYLEDARRNFQLVHCGLIPRSRGGKPEHGHTLAPPPEAAISEAEREEMRREIALLSVQLREKSSRKSTRNRSTRGGGGSRASTSVLSGGATKEADPLPSTEQLLCSRLSHRKALRGHDGFNVQSLNDMNGIWGSRRLNLRKLAAGDAQTRPVRAIASAPPKFYTDNSFSVPCRASKPATAAAPPTTSLSTRRRIQLLPPDKALSGREVTLEDLRLPVNTRRRGAPRAAIPTWASNTPPTHHNSAAATLKPPRKTVQIADC